ncbi:MAG: hypothetical protein WBL80_09380 [Erysipelotrichaceae bacterium]
MGALVWPKWAENVKATVTLFGDGLDENGGPKVETTWTGTAIASFKRKRVVDAKGSEIMSQGALVAKGDIAPGKFISGGETTINGAKYKIGAITRPVMTDGRIFHTRMELL